MNRRICVFLLLALLAALSACQQKSNNTVTHVPLTADEQRVAQLTSDIVHKFVFEKDRVYDIKTTLYQNGSGEVVGEVNGIDTKGADDVILISGRKDGAVGMAWNISSGSGIAKSPAAAIADDGAFMTASGIGREQFVMAEGKEYVLAYMAYQEGTQMSAAITELFYDWDTVGDKAGALKDFSYVYVVTAQLSDSPGYK